MTPAQLAVSNNMIMILDQMKDKFTPDQAKIIAEKAVDLLFDPETWDQLVKEMNSDE